MASLETAVTPTVAQMNAMHSAMIADPRSANWSTLQLLAPIEFQLSYAVVAAGASAYELNAQQGGVVDAGKLSGISFARKPFTTIGTMTDTTMLIIAPDNCTQKVWRSIQTDIMAKNDDSITVSLTSVQVPVVWNPRIAGKLT
jgi:hypothetical protein